MSVLAMTGSALMESATPMKSAKSARCEGRTRSESGEQEPRTVPPASGSMMPGGCRVKSAPSRGAARPTGPPSSPATTSRRTTATLVYAPSMTPSVRRSETARHKTLPVQPPQGGRPKEDAGHDLADDERQPRRASELPEHARQGEEDGEREEEYEDVVLGHGLESVVDLARGEARYADRALRPRSLLSWPVLLLPLVASQGCSSCTGAAQGLLGIMPGVVNDPSNRALRQSILGFGMKQFCQQMQTHDGCPKASAGL